MRSWIVAGGAYRTLWPSERDDYADHLKRLSPACRRLRFHRAVSDDGLDAHAERVFAKSLHVIGWFYRGVLRGAVEVAVFDGPDGTEAEAAFAVEAHNRGRGVGAELMHRAALYARNRGAETLHIATERDNIPMIRLAVSSGAQFRIHATEADGVLHQDARSVFSLLLETAEEEVGVLHWAWDRAMRWARRKWRFFSRRKTRQAA